MGLDPEPGRLPAPLRGVSTADAVFEFCRGIVDATAPFAAAFKPQIAHFAAQGAEAALEHLCHYIRDQHPSMLIILDVKRGDIGSTAKHYVTEAYSRYGADAATLSPYMGFDSIEPFLSQPDKGVFLLCRTSNAGGADLQDLPLLNGRRVFEQVAHLASAQWNALENLGLVVGATVPSDLASVRALAPTLPLLVPGIGAQGGNLSATLKAGLTPSGGLFINASRSIIYASESHDWQEAAAREARALRDAIEAER
ncbi:MAG: putative orotidine 5-phosphate decarboxylase [Pseudomonadota bacterium]